MLAGVWSELRQSNTTSAAAAAAAAAATNTTTTANLRYQPLTGYRIRRLIGRSRTVIKSKSASEWAMFVVSWFPTVLDNVVTSSGFSTSSYPSRGHCPYVAIMSSTYTSTSWMPMTS